MDLGNLKRVFAEYEKRATNYLEAAQEDLRDIEHATDQIWETCKVIESTVQNVKELSKHAQIRSYVPICKLAYIEALVKHTGEYNVELNSEYHCTLTAVQTIEFLEEKLAERKSMIDMYLTQKKQLEQRLNFDLDKTEDIPDTKDMPKEICSDRGIAFKRGVFYEIIEEESDKAYVKPTKRIARIKK